MGNMAYPTGANAGSAPVNNNLNNSYIKPIDTFTHPKKVEDFDNPKFDTYITQAEDTAQKLDADLNKITKNWYV